MRYDGTITAREAWAYEPHGDGRPFTKLEYGLRSLRYEFVKLVGDRAILRSTRSGGLFAVAAHRIPKRIQKRRSKVKVYRWVPA